MTDWSFDAWPSGEPYKWDPASRGTASFDQTDFHLDLGCGKLKKGRIGVDHFAAPGVNVIMDLDRLAVTSVARDPGKDAHGWDSYSGTRGLPFPDSSIESIISHHCLEHIGDGFMALMDDIYRVLKPGGLLRAITPLFPSHAAVADPDHRRYFCEGTWESFTGTPDNCWLESFSVPYTNSRFEMVDKDMTARSENPYDWWTERDAREMRVALIAQK